MWEYEYAVRKRIAIGDPVFPRLTLYTVVGKENPVRAVREEAHVDIKVASF
ncbi:MAG: hypothetical protein ACYDAR_15975 [Thermomicrobiales bacterium]